VSTKLGLLPTSQMDVDKPSQMSEDDMLMQMDMPVIDSKSSKSKPKTEDQRLIMTVLPRSKSWKLMPRPLISLRLQLLLEKQLPRKQMSLPKTNRQ